MKKLLLVLFLAALPAFAQLPGGKNYSLKESQLVFSYYTYESDGGFVGRCTHSLYNADMQDWAVVCGHKKFIVHLWLTEYRRPQLPKITFELLYWLSDSSEANRRGNHSGTSLWFNFKEPADMSHITIKQGTDNDTAGLYLDIKDLN